MVKHDQTAHDGSVKSCAVDPSFEFLATTGTEGTLKISSLEQTLEKAASKVIKEVKVTKKASVPLSSPQLLEVAWSPDSDGAYLAVAGETQLLVLSKRDNFAKEHFQPLVFHEREISIVNFLSENCLVTVGLDKTVKVWGLKNGP